MVRARGTYFFTKSHQRRPRDVVKRCLPPAPPVDFGAHGHTCERLPYCRTTTTPCEGTSGRKPRLICFEDPCSRQNGKFACGKDQYYGEYSHPLCLPVKRRNVENRPDLHGVDRSNSTVSMVTGSVRLSAHPRRCSPLPFFTCCRIFLPPACVVVAAVLLCRAPRPCR